MQNKQDLYDVILKPVMSEKSNNMNVDNKYTFFVDKRSSKSLVAKATEFIFNVKVQGVNIINSKQKKVVFKGVRGKQSSSKKAIVTLVAGDKIDLLKEVK